MVPSQDSIPWPVNCESVAVPIVPHHCISHLNYYWAFEASAHDRLRRHFVFYVARLCVCACVSIHPSVSLWTQCGNLPEIISEDYFRGLLQLMNLFQHVQCRWNNFGGWNYLSQSRTCLHVKQNTEIIWKLFRNNLYFSCNHGLKQCICLICRQVRLRWIKPSMVACHCRCHLCLVAWFWSTAADLSSPPSVLYMNISLSAHSTRPHQSYSL